MKLRNNTAFILKALYLFTFFRTSSMLPKSFRWNSFLPAATKKTEEKRHVEISQFSSSQLQLHILTMMRMNDEVFNAMYDTEKYGNYAINFNKLEKNTFQLEDFIINYVTNQKMASIYKDGQIITTSVIGDEMFPFFLKQSLDLFSMVLKNVEKLVNTNATSLAILRACYDNNVELKEFTTNYINMSKKISDIEKILDIGLGEKKMLFSKNTLDSLKKKQEENEKWLEKYKMLNLYEKIKSSAFFTGSVMANSDNATHIEQMKKYISESMKNVHSTFCGEVEMEQIKQYHVSAIALKELIYIHDYVKNNEEIPQDKKDGLLKKIQSTLKTNDVEINKLKLIKTALETENLLLPIPKTKEDPLPRQLQVTLRSNFEQLFRLHSEDILQSYITLKEKSNTDSKIYNEYPSLSILLKQKLNLHAKHCMDVSNTMDSSHSTEIRKSLFNALYNYLLAAKYEKDFEKFIVNKPSILHKLMQENNLGNLCNMILFLGEKIQEIIINVEVKERYMKEITVLKKIVNDNVMNDDGKIFVLKNVMLNTDQMTIQLLSIFMEIVKRNDLEVCKKAKMLCCSQIQRNAEIIFKMDTKLFERFAQGYKIFTDINFFDFGENVFSYVIDKMIEDTVKKNIILNIDMYHDNHVVFFTDKSFALLKNMMDNTIDYDFGASILWMSCYDKNQSLTVFAEKYIDINNKIGNIKGIIKKISNNKNYDCDKLFSTQILDAIKMQKGVHKELSKKYQLSAFRYIIKSYFKDSFVENIIDKKEEYNESLEKLKFYIAEKINEMNQVFFNEEMMDKINFNYTFFQSIKEILDINNYILTTQNITQKLKNNLLSQIQKIHNNNNLDIKAKLVAIKNLLKDNNIQDEFIKKINKDILNISDTQVTLPSFDRLGQLYLDIISNTYQPTLQDLSKILEKKYSNFNLLFIQINSVISRSFDYIKGIVNDMKKTSEEKKNALLTEHQNNLLFYNKCKDFYDLIDRDPAVFDTFLKDNNIHNMLDMVRLLKDQLVTLYKEEKIVLKYQIELSELLKSLEINLLGDVQGSAVSEMDFNMLDSLIEIMNISNKKQNKTETSVQKIETEYSQHESEAATQRYKELMKIKDLEKQYNILQKQVDKIKTNLQEEKAKKSELEDKNSYMKQKIATIEKQRNEKKVEYDEYILNNNNQILEKQAQYENLQQEYTLLLKEIADKQENYKIQLEEYQQQMKNHQQQSELKKQRYLRVSEEQRNKIEELNSFVEKLLEENRNLTTQKDVFMKDFEKQKENNCVLSEKNTSLTLEKEIYIKQINHQLEEINNYQQLQAEQLVLDKEEEELEKLQRQMSELLENKQDLESKYELLLKNNLIMSPKDNNLKQAKSDVIDSNVMLYKTLEDHNKDLVSMEKKVENLKAEISQLIQERVEVKKETMYFIINIDSTCCNLLYNIKCNLQQIKQSNPDFFRTNSELLDDITELLRDKSTEILIYSSYYYDKIKQDKSFDAIHDENRDALNKYLLKQTAYKTDKKEDDQQKTIQNVNVQQKFSLK